MTRRGAPHTGAPSRPSQRGTGLIELMVALLCSSLVAAGVLSLVGDAAWLCRQQRARAEARGLAELTADLVARVLREAGQGLEGAAAVRWRGTPVPVIELGSGEPPSGAAPGAASSSPVLLAVVAATGPAVEVEPAAAPTGDGDPSGRRRSYRAATVRPPGGRRWRVLLAAEDRVVGLGMADDEGNPSATAPAGTVREVSVSTGIGTVVIDWDEPPAAEVRAVVPVRRRELGLRPFEGALQLRRRDDDGNWQPMIDSVRELVVEPQDAAGPAAGAAGSGARAAAVTATVELPSGATAIARRRVVLRGAS